MQYLSKKQQAKLLFSGFFALVSIFLASALLPITQTSNAASVTITSTKVSPSQQPVKLTGSSFVVDFCNEGGGDDCEKGTTSVTFIKEGGMFIARDIDVSVQQTRVTRHTCNYNINVWYGANSSNANLTPEHRGGWPCPDFSTRSIPVTPTDINIAPPSDIVLKSNAWALYIPADMPPVNVSGDSFTIKFCQTDKYFVSEPQKDLEIPYANCDSPGSAVFYKEGNSYIVNAINIKGGPYTCNYTLRANIGDSAGNIQITKNGGNPCPASVDKARTLFAIVPASICENKYPAGAERDACKDGALDANKDNASYCDEKYRERPAEKDACKAGQETRKGVLPPEEREESTSSTCSIEGIGWMVCPVLKFMGGLLDGSYAIIRELTAVPGKILGDPAQRAWSAFRDIANIIIIIAFMIIVFSQVSSFGVSNYGIKKMLPKLIAVTILMNLSFFLCQIALDVSNILGTSIYELLKTMPVYESSGGFLEKGNIVSDVIGYVLMGGVALVAGAGAVVGGIAFATIEGALVILIPIIIAALVAVLVTVTILVLRPSIVIILTVLAPLAFVALLFPNTNKFYKKWLQIFVAVLSLYVGISVLFGGSQLAAAILAQSMGFGEASFKDNIGAGISVIAVLNLPLLAALPMIKGSLNAIPMVGNMLTSIRSAGKNLSSLSRKTLKDNAGLAAATAQRNPSNKFARLVSQGLSGREFNIAGRTFGRTRSTLRAAQAAQAYNEAEIKASAYDTQDLLVQEAVDAVVSGKVTDSRTGKLRDTSQTERLALIDKAMTSGGFNQRREILEVLSSGNMGNRQEKELVNRAIKISYSKGDQTVYGVGFGDNILSGGIKGEEGLRSATKKNIEAGNVDGTHMVQSQGMSEYMIDVATGIAPTKDAENKVIKNAQGKAVKASYTAVPGSRTAVDNLVSAIDNARTGDSTRTVANGVAYKEQFDRIAPTPTQVATPSPQQPQPPQTPQPPTTP